MILYSLVGCYQRLEGQAASIFDVEGGNHLQDCPVSELNVRHCENLLSYIPRSVCRCTSTCCGIWLRTIRKVVTNVSDELGDSVLTLGSGVL